MPIGAIPSLLTRAQVIQLLALNDVIPLDNIVFTPADPENPTDVEQAILDILDVLKDAGIMTADEY